MALADRYDLVKLLGAGSFGQVFRAVDRLLGRTVAIKVLHRQDDDARRRFHREAVILHSQLTNEHVVGLLDHAGLNDGDPYLVLELCEFGSLRSWVGTDRGWRDVATALLHAAKGLVGVHAAGGLHRDIKPENLLLSGASSPLTWMVKLADFGLAGFPHPVTGRMTRSAAGTPGYIAPELANMEFHPRADIYSLGIVGVELLVGRIDVASLAFVEAPSALKAVIQSMVGGLTASRPTAAVVVARLEALLTPRPVTVEPAPPRVASGGDTLAKGLAVVGFGALAVGFLSWLGGGRGTYYDSNVDRNRGPDGRFRS